MVEIRNIDLGSIKIHKKVIADIAVNAIAELEGVSLPSGDLWGQFLEVTGIKKYPAITVTVEQNGQTSVEMKVLIRYGLNLPETALRVQEVVREAIQRSVEIDLKDVNVNIYGIERGER